MNCSEFSLVAETRPFATLGEAERQQVRAHAMSCRRCAPSWVVYAELSAVRVPPMPPELATRCRTLATAQPRPSVLRFASRGAWMAIGGFAVLAAAAGVVTSQYTFRPDARSLAADEPAADAVPTVGSTPQATPDSPSAEPGDPNMNSTTITTAAIALGIAAAAQAQTPSADIPEPRIRTAEEIIAANDLNRDGIVMREEAAKVNGNLFVMWNDVYDTDLDGKIDVAELKRAMEKVQVGTALDKITGESGGNMAAARPEAILANNDLDKDGVVTREEAKTAGKALIRMWDSYDLNKDGKVELAELAKAQGY